MNILALVLLWSGVAAELLCCIGVWWMHGIFDRLHYAAAATTTGPVLIGISAGIVGAGGTTGTVQILTCVAVVVAFGPLVTHATGRAGRRLLHDDIGPKPENP